MPLSKRLSCNNNSFHASKKPRFEVEHMRYVGVYALDQFINPTIDFVLVERLLNEIKDWKMASFSMLLNKIIIELKDISSIRTPEERKKIILKYAKIIELVCNKFNNLIYQSSNADLTGLAYDSNSDYPHSGLVISTLLFRLGKLLRLFKNNNLLESISILTIPVENYCRISKELRYKSKIHGQSLANLLFSISQLAPYFDHMFPVDELEKVLKLIPQSHNLSPESIFYVFNSLEELTARSFISDPIEATTLEAIIKAFIRLNHQTYQIRFVFFIVGKLAEKELIKGQFSSQLFEDYINILVDSSDFNCEKDYCFNVIDQIIRNDNLLDPIHAQYFEKLLKKILQKATQDNYPIKIGEIFLKIGSYAKEKCLTGIISTVWLESYLHLVKNDRLNLSGSLYGIGLLAEAGCFDKNEPLCTDLIEGLLQKSHQFDSSISRFIFYGLGLIASASFLTKPISANLLNNSLQLILQDKNLCEKYINQILYHLGMLVQAELVEGEIDKKLLSGFLDFFNRNKPIEFRNLAMSLQGISVIITNQFEPAWKFSYLNNLLECINTIINQPNLAKKPLDGVNCILGICALLKQNNHEPSSHDLDTIKSLIRLSLSGSYLPFMNAINLINALTFLPNQYKSHFHHNFLQISTVIKLPLRIFPYQQQKQLNRILNDLDTYPNWQKILKQTLELSISKHSLDHILNDRPPNSTFSNPPMTTIPRTTTNHVIYLAIQNRDEMRLRQLLHLIHHLRQSLPAKINNNRETNPRHNTGEFEVVQRRPHVLTHAEELIISFFSDIDADSLRELILDSEAKYFAFLIDACSQHIRYYLAQNHCLEPIILYINPSQLELFINHLVSPGQIYRDEKAFIAVLNALTIRKAQQPADHELIDKLQHDLLTRAFEFHRETKHPHVALRLQKLQGQLNQHGLTLIEMSLHTSERLTRQPLPQQSIVQDSNNGLGFFNTNLSPYGSTNSNHRSFAPRP